MTNKDLQLLNNVNSTSADINNVSVSNNVPE